jgi:hypothetical protein
VTATGGLREGDQSDLPKQPENDALLGFLIAGLLNSAVWIFAMPGKEWSYGRAFVVWMLGGGTYVLFMKWWSLRK